jgi:hypothetical protein
MRKINALLGPYARRNDLRRCWWPIAEALFCEVSRSYLIVSSCSLGSLKVTLTDISLLPIPASV